MMGRVPCGEDRRGLMMFGLKFRCCSVSCWMFRICGQWWPDGWRPSGGARAILSSSTNLSGYDTGLQRASPRAPVET